MVTLAQPSRDADGSDSCQRADEYAAARNGRDCEAICRPDIQRCYELSTVHIKGMHDAM